jgi:formyl-CoA transferase
MRFPWAEVASISGLVNSPQLKERGFWVKVEHPESGKRYRFPGAPCKLSRSPWRVGSRVPNVGEHNKDIYQGERGLSEDEIKTLAEDGVI